MKRKEREKPGQRTKGEKRGAEGGGEWGSVGDRREGRRRRGDDSGRAKGGIVGVSRGGNHWTGTITLDAFTDRHAHRASVLSLCLSLSLSLSLSVSL